MINFVPGDGGVSVDDPQDRPHIRNFPNPVNGSTTISFANMQAAGKVVHIYNTKGQLVKDLPISGNQHSVEWNGTGFDDTVVPNGIYFYTIDIGDQEVSNKLLLLR